MIPSIVNNLIVSYHYNSGKFSEDYMIRIQWSRKGGGVGVGVGECLHSFHCGMKS